MKNRLLFFSLKRIELFLIGCILLFNCSKEEPNIGEKLWYTNPSKDWFSALPLGNGRLGAMVYGTISEEHIQLNEESLWSGTPEETYPKDLAKHYQKFRELNLQRKFTQAKSYGLKHFEVKNYKRSLDLETGISTVIYSVDGKRYLRESFVSAKYDAMFFHFKSLDDEKMTSIIRYDRERDISKFINNDKFIQVNGQLEVLADDLHSTIRVYPSPTNHYLNIKNFVEGSSVSIKKILGKTIYKGYNQPKVDVSSLNTGIYFVTILNENKISTAKFIKK